MVDGLISFYGMSTRTRLFCAKRFENHVNWPLIFTFFEELSLKSFFYTYMILYSSLA